MNGHHDSRATSEAVWRRELSAARADAARLYEASAIFDRVDDHTYCHDETPGGCVVAPLREARRAHDALCADENPQ